MEEQYELENLQTPHDGAWFLVPSPKTEFTSGEICWRCKSEDEVRARRRNKLCRGMFRLSEGDLLDAYGLTRLSLSDNALSGQIPVELSKLTSLEELKLDGNPVYMRHLMPSFEDGWRILKNFQLTI